MTDLTAIKDALVEDILVVLGSYSTENLRKIAEAEHEDTPGSRWLPEMVDGYLEMWR